MSCRILKISIFLICLRFDHSRRIQLSDLENLDDLDFGKNKNLKFVAEEKSSKKMKFEQFNQCYICLSILGWKHYICQSPYIQIFTRIKWSLLKDPLFLITALGSAYSFNALLNFYLLLPLHANSYNFTVDEKVLK
jgi:hypothetical protein